MADLPLVRPALTFEHLLTRVRMSELVVLQKYHSEVEAQVAAAILEASGIPARVLADTAGGALPSLSLLFPARLLVRVEDEPAAREALKGAEQRVAEDPDEGE